MGLSSEQADGGSVATAMLARMAIVATLILATLILATLILAGVLGEKLIPQKVGTAYTVQIHEAKRSRWSRVHRR
jgi:hypothetical protein